VTRPFTIVCLLTLVVGCQRAPAEVPNAEAKTDASTKQDSVSVAAATPGIGAAVQTVAAQEGNAAQPATPATPAKPVPAVLPEVLARVNGEAINKAEFEKALNTVQANAGSPIPPERRDEIYRGVLDQLVSFHLLMQESKTRKIQVTDADVDSRVAEVKKQFPSEDDFNKALASRSMTLESLKAEARQEMTLSKLVESEVKALVNVQESDIKTFYDTNPDKFQQPESVRASHILIRLEPTATDAQKKEARAKADDLLKQIKAGGDFAALAKQHSQDGSATQGGDLNFFAKGQMVPPFEQAAFALQPGQVSDVVETQFGYHIIKTTEKRPARLVPLAEVAQRIGEFLTGQQQQEKTQAFINALRAKSKIEILI
jgi:peptidyl-prolyl cis-trans isomerase C